MKCPNCGFDSPPEMRYCGACGFRLAFTCADCGFANPLDFRFCGMCGAKFILDAAGPPREQPPAPVAPAPEEAPPGQFPPHLEGERRVVTVIVTDLTDSTQLLEKLGTEAWVDLMNRILHILESEIYRFGGEVSQFRGDGLVAFFGAISAHEDDSERAVLAALSMQRAFNSYCRELTQPEAIDLKMRVGINTGEVIVASGSERQHWEETAMGMAISVAARMESSAEPGTILVSEQTFSLVQAQFEWKSLGNITVKGVSQPIEVYRPLAHITDPAYSQEARVFSNSIPRIGRDSEFQALKECVKSVFNGRGQIAAVLGEKGSGKSFLLREVRQYFVHRGSLLAESGANPPAETPDLVWVNGRCRSYSQAWPYFMWLDLFRNWLEFQLDDSKDVKSACLHRRAEELWGERFDEHYPYLATFLGLPLEEAYSEKIRHLDGEQLRRRYFLAVRSWIETACRKGPVVLVFSDLQWADDSSLALLEYCLPICDNESLLWALAYRPEHETPILKLHHYLETDFPHRLTSVNLQPLTESQSRELINQLIGSKILPSETVNLIIHNAAGNPYYILELVRVLISKGILTCNEDCSEWQVTRKVTTLDLPDSLQQLLSARIDRLTAQERLVFQVAAVIGPVFWFNLLQSLLGEMQTLKTCLASLQRVQFIEESGRVPELGMQYIIRSPLLRDTAYESLLSPQRAANHLKIAEYLEGISAPDIPGGYDGMLAYHYRGAGNSKKELFYTLLAADQARKIYANAEALQHYTRALELLDILEAKSRSPEESRLFMTERFETLNDRRDVFLLLGQIEASRQDTQALLPLARKMEDDPPWLIDALLAHADFPVNGREELQPCLRMAETALGLARERFDRQRELRSLISVAQLRLNLRDHAALGIAEEALDLARQLGDLKTEVNLLLGIGNAYGMDDLPRSREYLEAALVRSEKINDKNIEVRLLEALGRQFEREGDYYRQLTEYEIKRLQISREIGNRYIEGMALMFCGQIQGLYLGDYETGMGMERQALQTWENITGRIFPLVRIAQIQATLGNYPDALATLETASPLADKVVMDIGRAGLGIVTAIVYNSLGDEQRLCQALDITSQIQQMVADNLVSRQYQMTAACEASTAHLKLADLKGGNESAEGQEHLRRALEMSQSALNTYEQFGFVQVVECTSEEILYRHSQALAANEQLATAAAYLKRAYQEMMRKHTLIPADSPFRNTYLEIPLHREILAAYAPQVHP